MDKGLRDIILVIEKFYASDNKTCYVFTSDHGMTDWGSHGAGTPHETYTPFITWGAGIKAISNFSIENFIYPKQTINIEQVDIAPYISCLLGIPTPLNSLGRLPFELLINPLYQQQCLLGNTLQIYQQYKFLRQKVKTEIHRSYFTPFEEHM
ncbi:unnamed protein product [Gordionus sp. m RMFG-2023]